jgi:uncharacterized protein (DUF1684 family)
MKKLFLPFLLFASMTSGFSQNVDFESWKTQRQQELLAEDGWVNLIALLWFDENLPYLNLSKNDSLLLSDSMEGKNIGTFQFRNDSIWFYFNQKIAKKSKLQPPARILQFPVVDYTKGGVYYDRWKWSVIKRGEKFGMRLRDLKHPALTDFKPIPYFDYDSAFRVDALFVPKFNETMDIPNVLGQIVEWKVMGILKFELQGKFYELTALDEAGKFFVIFSDLTNESETYPIGRYLYVNYPDKNGRTTLDFNFAYNPPCAFTAFATCPIPPRQNRLETSISAGEKIPK